MDLLWTYKLSMNITYPSRSRMAVLQDSHWLARILQNKQYLESSCTINIMCKNFARFCKIYSLYRLGQTIGWYISKENCKLRKHQSQSSEQKNFSRCFSCWYNFLSDWFFTMLNLDSSFDWANCTVKGQCSSS